MAMFITATTTTSQCQFAMLLFPLTMTEFLTGHSKGRKIYFGSQFQKRQTDDRQTDRQAGRIYHGGENSWQRVPTPWVESSEQSQKWVSPSRLAPCDSLLALPYVSKGSHKLPKEYYRLGTKCLNMWAYGGISHLYCSRGSRLKGTNHKDKVLETVGTSQKSLLADKISDYGQQDRPFQMDGIWSRPYLWHLKLILHTSWAYIFCYFMTMASLKLVRRTKAKRTSNLETHVWFQPWAEWCITDLLTSEGGWWQPALGDPRDVQ